MTLIHGGNAESCNAIRFATAYAAAQGWIRSSRSEVAGLPRLPILARSVPAFNERKAVILRRARLRTLDDSVARRERVQAMLQRLGVDLDQDVNPYDGKAPAVLVLSPDCLTELTTRPHVTLRSLQAILARDPAAWVLFSQDAPAVPALASLESLVAKLHEILEASASEPPVLLPLNDDDAQPPGTWESEAPDADLGATGPAP